MRWDKLRPLLGAVLLLTGGGFIALGALRGEVFTAFQKAVNLCFECIGLG